MIFYADKATDSITSALAEMARRRERQEAHNAAHGIVPRTIVKAIRDPLEVELRDGASAGAGRRREAKTNRQAEPSFEDRRALVSHIEKLRQEMHELAKNLDFETAAQIRDEMLRLEKLDLEFR